MVGEWREDQMGNSGSEPEIFFLSVVRIDEMLEESGIKKNVRSEREIVFV